MLKSVHLGRLSLFLLSMFLACVYGMSPIQAEAQTSGQVKVYLDSAGRSFAEGSSLFRGAFMPGDEESGKLTFINQSDTDLYTLIKVSSSDSGGLIDSLKLDITDEDALSLYSGSLMSLYAYTGRIAAGKSRTFCLTLSLPKSAGNDLAGSMAEFDFLILVSETDMSIEGGSSSDSGGSDPDSSPSGGSSSGGSSGTGGSDSGGSSGTSSSGSSSGSGSSGGSSGGSSYGGSSYGRTGFGGSGIRESNSVIYGSSYDRDFGTDASGNLTPGTTRSGFAGNAQASGGGAEKVYSAPDYTMYQGVNTGSWQYGADGYWRYLFSNGSYAAGGFAFLYNPSANLSDPYSWFYFDSEGRMAVGWIKAENDVWYFAHDVSDGDLGVLMIGWLSGSEDGRLYYLSEVDAKMMTGWIGFSSGSGTDYYYFATLSDTYSQNWFFNTSVGRWLYDKLGRRSYGSMYRDEDTPDGSHVDSLGRKSGNDETTKVTRVSSL